VLVVRTVDHALDEVMGWHAAKLGDRWAAVEEYALPDLQLVRGYLAFAGDRVQRLTAKHSQHELRQSRPSWIDGTDEPRYGAGSHGMRRRTVIAKDAQARLSCRTAGKR
jgi:hypothetical protein